MRRRPERFVVRQDLPGIIDVFLSEGRGFLEPRRRERHQRRSSIAIGARFISWFSKPVYFVCGSWLINVDSGGPSAGELET